MSDDVSDLREFRITRRGRVRLQLDLPAAAKGTVLWVELWEGRRVVGLLMYGRGALPMRGQWGVARGE